MDKILIVDDDERLCRMLTRRMQRQGYDTFSACTLLEGLDKATTDFFDVIFLDVEMPDGDGLEFLAKFKKTPSSPEVIIITGQGDPDGAEKAIKNGAWGYVEKPDIINEIGLHLNRALQYRREKKRAQMVPLQLKRQNIIVSGREISYCLDLLAQASVSDISVHISGETGTGKEVFARAIHVNSCQAANNFVVVDCASLPETLIESTLFGHVKGAFTGADKAADGLVKQADGGTLFLDEVGELPLNTQKSFLRVLQERSYRPVGATQEIFSDFRLVSATNQNLEEMVKAGTFRKDLLFRLQAFSIDLPPLRERVEDIKELVTYFMDKFYRRYGQTESKGLGPNFLSTLVAYDWPGNIRELSQALEQAYARAANSPTLFSYYLPEVIRINQARRLVKGKPHSGASQDSINPTAELPTWREYKDECEKEYLNKALLQAHGNIKTAMKISSLSRTRLYQLLKKYELLE